MRIIKNYHIKHQHQQNKDPCIKYGNKTAFTYHWIIKVTNDTLIVAFGVSVVCFGFEKIVPMFILVFSYC